MFTIKDLEYLRFKSKYHELKGCAIVSVNLSDSSDYLYRNDQQNFGFDRLMHLNVFHGH